MKQRLLLLLKGMAMGGADIIPGVSGGTIAFITGIYEELIHSIKSVDANAIALLFSFRFKEFWEKVNGPFLITLVLGILISAFSLVQLLSHLLENYPIQLWSFFFGLILVSAILVARQVRTWSVKEVVAGLIGIIVAFLITQGTASETPDDLWFIYICGAIAICAMILPGISGSFILVLLGKYEYIINAIKDFNIGVLVVFALGCITGIAAFSRLVSWLLARYHSMTISLLAGFMLGSLNKIWPWKEVQSENNILPNVYQSQGTDPYLAEALLFFAVGVLLVILIEKLAHSLKETK